MSHVRRLKCRSEKTTHDSGSAQMSFFAGFDKMREELEELEELEVAAVLNLEARVICRLELTS